MEAAARRGQRLSRLQSGSGDAVEWLRRQRPAQAEELDVLESIFGTAIMPPRFSRVHKSPTGCLLTEISVQLTPFYHTGTK